MHGHLWRDVLLRAHERVGIYHDLAGALAAAASKEAATVVWSRLD
jgi:hypothetical protein